ncbi:YeeE/YedE thiosulfate transporter family protein [Geminicoccus harenae]|uniref:YeeE/YedE thiosulfate transporter family protein n=2 Tax=Geminicoccus harenae TaxID=2498453 RepID=UPI001C950D7C|nr:YeeE/YedE thiosulfate transporter family protein [Geminicoccus harenae]
MISPFLIGLLFGVVAARSHFCTMGALSDFFLFGSTRRLRSIASALAVALAGTALLAFLGWPVFGSGQSELPWLAALLGPLAFGVGMTLAGGCITRNLVRAGLGSAKAGLTLLVAGLVALAVTGGILAAPADWLRRPATVLSLPPGLLAAAAALAALALAAWVLMPARERGRARQDIIAGALLGLTVPLWHLLVTAGPLPPMPSFILPLGELLARWSSGPGAHAGAMLVLGTLAGAALLGLVRRSHRFEGFADAGDLQRHLLGGLLMGLGGGLAGVCSFGLAVSGSAALLPAAILGTVALAVGCRQTLRVLEGRSFFSR